ncbi:MAG: HAMP domain-containing histidine kinase [Verrucomicrobiales bacterium]|nr:HAMP domain-containing histidine kinase [Verrucomicrobiales bacterium]
MDPEAIEGAIARLRADHDAIPWGERVGLVRRLMGKAGRVRPLTASAGELLRLFAEDSKWEVRKEVADNLHRLGDSDFAAFAAILSRDDNSFVNSAAERALERRRKGQHHEVKRARGLDRIEDELRNIEARHGRRVAGVVRDTAHRLYEGLVGASVHEMRSIVTAMKANVENLDRCPDADAGEISRKVALRLSRSISFLERLLDDMRDYTRAPSRDRASERVADLVSEALEMVGAEFASKGRDASGVAVHLSVPPDLIAMVSRVQMVLCLRNLLKNAHEAYMADETSFTMGHVEVKAGEFDGGVRITIRDGGMGMSEEELSSVLQFLPGRTSKGYLGTGFGLPIARCHILAHGGDLRIESQPDQGTVVTVLLPASGRRES